MTTNRWVPAVLLATGPDTKYFRTAFVARTLEFGVDGEADVAYSDEFDINASDFLDLADQLGH